MSKRITILFAAVALAALSACSRPARKAAVKDTLYRHLDGDLSGLDPTIANEELAPRVEDLLFRPLLGVDKQLGIVPGLALTWAVSSDGKVYDFRLDPKARWEDGSPVTSADVAFTIDRIRNPKVAAVNWKWGFEDVAKVETPDPLTVIVRFEHPYAERLLAFNAPIVSSAAFAKNPEAMARHPVGTGPYRLESWEPNQKITLVRRADVAASQFPFAKIVFRIIPDNAVRFRAGSQGDLDEFRVTRDQRAVAEHAADFQAHNRLLKAPQFLIVAVVYNLHNPFLADKRVRRALELSWPRAETALRLYPPEGAKLISGPYPAGARENDPDVPPPSQDPAAAGRLLDEAGWKLGSDRLRHREGKTATLEFLYPSGQPITANLAQIFQQAYGKIGVELKLRALDWAAYSQRFAAGEFELAPFANIFLPPHLDQYPYLHSSQAPPAGENVGFYRNPEADRAIEAARQETNEDKRIELYRQVHRIVAADPPADFLWSAEQYWAVSKTLTDVETSPLGLFHFLPGPLAWKPIPAAK